MGYGASPYLSAQHAQQLQQAYGVMAAQQHAANPALEAYSRQYANMAANPDVAALPAPAVTAPLQSQ